MTKSKRKILISLLATMFVLLSAVAVIAIAFALTQQTITSTLTVSYTVEDIDGSVYATYKIGSGEEKYLVPTALNGGELDAEHKQGNALVFKAKDKGNAGTLEFPTTDQNISLDSKNDNVILKYTYSNTGDKHYMASMSFASALTMNNVTVEYSKNGTDYSTDRYAVVVPAETDNCSYWIKISITNKAKDASLTGNFNWNLKACDPQSESYVALTSLEFKGSNGSYSASLSNAGGTDGKIVFPSSINGDPVTTITQSNMTQSEKDKIKEIVIPDGITEIGIYAFSWFRHLTEADVPDSVGSINNYAFYVCESLETLKIGKNVSSIGSWAFANTPKLARIIVDPENATYYSSDINGDYNCIIAKTSKKLLVGCKTTIIPNGTLKIESEAFILCSSLTSINIPASVTQMGSENPFGGCETLTSITVDSANTNYYVKNNCLIENSTKRLVSGLNVESITIPTDVKIIGYRSFYNYRRLQSVDISIGVTKIESGAFLNCRALTNVTLPNTLTEMGASFLSTALTTITIPASVTTILANPFSACQNLTNVIIEEGNENFYILDNCIIEKNTNTLITAGVGVSVVPDVVQIIGNSAFGYSSNVSNISIPNSVTKIDNNAFQACYDLTSITIPSSVNQIGKTAFSSCTNLTSVTFENTSGWFVTWNETATSGTNLSSGNLSNTTTAATYLTSTHVGKFWKRA